MERIFSLVNFIPIIFYRSITSSRTLGLERVKEKQRKKKERKGRDHQKRNFSTLKNRWRQDSNHRWFKSNYSMVSSCIKRQNENSRRSLHGNSKVTIGCDVSFVIRYIADPPSKYLVNPLAKNQLQEKEGVNRGSWNEETTRHSGTRPCTALIWFEKITQATTSCIFASSVPKLSSNGTIWDC